MVTIRQTRLQETFSWLKLYSLLASSVKQEICGTKLQSWKGQEYDLAQDVIQETVVRTFLQMRKAEKGEGVPVLSPNSFSRRVAKNYLLDRVRREARLVRPSCDIELQQSMMKNWIDPCQGVLDAMEIESLFVLIASVIAGFPNKLRNSMLIDLADLTPVDEPFRPLQQALKRVNIDLDMYRNLAPTDEVGKKRHSSLISQGYKRLRNVVLAQLHDL